MECPGLLSKGDLGPLYCCYLVHSQNYKVSGEGTEQGLVVAELIRGGVTDELLHHPMPELLHSTLLQMPEMQWRCPHLGIYSRKGGKTTKLLFFVIFLFCLLLYISCIFLFVFVQGHRFSFVGALIDFLKLYLVPTFVLLIAWHCQWQVMVRCYVYIR